jgi:hypothetical protein
MNNLFRRLKASWLYLRKYPYVALPADYWTHTDAKAWSNFLGSDTGVKLRHIRWNRVYDAQQKAVIDRIDPAYSAGIAFGILGMVHSEDELLEISLPTGELSENQTTPGSSGFRSVNR